THRGSIYLEDAEILSNDAFDGNQFVLRVNAPKLAAAAEPGNFAHIRCNEMLPMRRPMSVMRADRRAGWIEFLYKRVGEGTRLLSRTEAGERISLLGPIGVPFKPSAARRRPLLIGGGVGIPPMVFLADRLRAVSAEMKPVVLMGSEVPFPFRPRPSQIMIPGMPPGVIACMPLMEDWGIPSRLSSLKGFAGCFEGYVTDLARAWIESVPAPDRAQVEIFACGPTPMLQATQTLAGSFGLPSQLCLEEYMACAVGGCAGCAVRIRTADGVAMKRVCVDGPVFDGDTVVFDAA
ncbi:MAG TPA: dihydroorotate dehydrogenase electron transfer subunit, partial [Gammaproteobacteria bacterium]|nr:dihydroorotate dehydrogenase electron transfer subunit [Gammaproteobacteria bacterium]